MASDLDDFAELGGIAQMFVVNGKMHFDLNLGVAKGSRVGGSLIDEQS